MVSAPKGRRSSGRPERAPASSKAPVEAVPAPSTTEEQYRGRYLDALRARWIYVVIAVVVAVGSAAIFVFLATPRYDAEADILVDPVPAGTLVGLPVLHEQATGSSVVTAARLAKSPQVATRARDLLGLDVTPSVTVTPQQQSNIITIIGSDKSPETAAKIANAFAQALVTERTERYQKSLNQATADLSRRLRSVPANSAEAAAIASQLAAFRALSPTDPTLRIASAAVPPPSAAWPRPVLTIGVAVLIGLLLGIGIAVAAEVANPLVLRTETFSGGSRPPVLAHMQRPSVVDVRTALTQSPGSPSDFRVPIRTLWARLGALQPDQSPARMFLIAGAEAAADGGATVAALLADSIARAGMTVALVDADFERGSLSPFVDSANASVASIGQLVREDARHAEASRGRGTTPPGRTVSRHRLRALMADPRDRLSEKLSPHELSALLEDLQDEVNAIVISAPPPPAAETMVLSEVVDSVIVVVEMGRTSRDRLADLLDELAARRIVPAGFVALDQPSLSTRIADAGSSLKKPVMRGRWT